MTAPAPAIPAATRRRLSGQRGSALIVALLFAVVISMVLGSYLGLGGIALKLAHRTYFANDAANLAEAGLEEALYCFNQMGAGKPAATAWSDWTITGTDAMYTLPTFNRDQNAVGVVKVYVTGYDGSVTTPTVFSQATITPFDGSAPVVKTLRIALQGGNSTLGIVALNGLILKNSSSIDSFNSNPAGNPAGPWQDYSAAIATSQAKVGVLAGSISVANGKVYGDLFLGPGVASPAPSDHTGTITTNYTGSYPMPAYPTAAGVSKSYDLGTSLPGTLPRAGDQPASDGRYYYFCHNATIGAVTIKAGDAVAIVGTNTGMTNGLTIQNLGTCAIYMDKTLVLGTNKVVNDTNWAGALQVFTTTTGNCTFASNSRFTGSLFAPGATLTASGSGANGLLVGSFVADSITVSNKMNIHFDQALQPGGAWTVTNWLEFQSVADRATVAGLTNNFLR